MAAPPGQGGSARRRGWGGFLDLSGCGSCQVVACDRPSRSRDGVYCEAHQAAVAQAQRDRAGQSETRWRRTEVTGQRRRPESVMRGMTDRWLSRRYFLDCSNAAGSTASSPKTAICGGGAMSCAASRPPRRATTVPLAGARSGPFTAMVNSIGPLPVWAMASPETEIARDTWDLAVFGQNGTLAFTGITQDLVAARRPNGGPPTICRAAGSARGGAPAPGWRCVTTSAAWHGYRSRCGCAPDHGEHPQRWAAADMETFLHRLAYSSRCGQISADARTRACREVRAVLTGIRAIGLTRPGGSGHGLGDDFAIYAGDIPAKPEPGQNRTVTCPPRSCDSSAPTWIELTSPEMRTAVELAIDTGRRPEEICACATTA